MLISWLTPAAAEARASAGCRATCASSCSGATGSIPLTSTILLSLLASLIAKYRHESLHRHRRHQGRRQPEQRRAASTLVARRSEPTAKTGSNDALALQVIRMVDEACAEAGVDPSAVQSRGRVVGGPVRDARRPRRTGRAQHLRRHRRPGARPAERLDAPRCSKRRCAGASRRCGSRTTASPRWRPSAAGARCRAFDHCAYVTWSTGIGIGLCVDGRVLRGKNGNAGHAGHMFVSDNDDALCGCGNVGDVEALVAGNAVARRFGADAATLLQRAQAGDAAGRDHGRCAVPRAGPHALQPGGHARPAAHQPGRQRVLEQPRLPAAAPAAPQVAGHSCRR